MFYILIAILLFGVIIALHELGHFVAAKLCGVKVNEFAIGMGPLLFQRRRGETEYSLRLLPIGGYCAMEGEGEEGQGSSDPRAFPNRPWWQRVVILLAGVTMNFLTGLFIILCFFAAGESFSAPVVAGFTENWTAQEQGLALGDRICKVDDHAIYLTTDIELFLSRASSDTVTLEVERGGERVVLPDYQFAGTKLSDGSTQFVLGITAGREEATVGTVLRNSWYQAIDYVRIVWLSLGDMVTGAVGLRDMSGVVGIVSLVGELGESGAEAAQAAGRVAFFGAMENILWFMAFIAINLAVMNLLPIPALDGGQIFLMAIDGILLALRGRKLDGKYRDWASVAGFLCLMALMLLITISDVLKQFGV